ncbi:casein kinase I [Gracilaria domingensis]|nr:casein kinase I [Gracilaria domingensis]
MLDGGHNNLRAGWGGRRRARILCLHKCPVENVVISKAFSEIQVAEEAAQVGIVRPVVEAERATVPEVGGKLGRVVFAQLVDGGGDFAVGYLLVLLLLGGGAQALPWERAAVEVHEHKAERLEVVATALLNAEMGVDGGVAGGTGEVLVLSVRDVNVGLVVAVLFGEAKVDDVDDVGLLSEAHQKVVGLDVAVQKGSRVDVLDPLDHLVGEHEHGLEGEATVAKVEKVLERGTEQIDGHDIVLALDAVPADARNADDGLTVGGDVEVAVDLALVDKLWVLCLAALELDGNLFVGVHVDADVDVAEGAGADATAEAPFSADSEVRSVGHVEGRRGVVGGECGVGGGGGGGGVGTGGLRGGRGGRGGLMRGRPRKGRAAKRARRGRGRGTRLEAKAGAVEEAAGGAVVGERGGKGAPATEEAANART